MGFGTGHVFKTTDGGQSWTRHHRQPAGCAGQQHRDRSAKSPNDVYVASDVGVFVATDGGVTGETWQRMGTGLPDTVVVQLKLSQVGSRVLVAATHGRGAWAIAPLTNQPDFALGATPDVQSLKGAASGSVQVTARAINGYSGTLTLSCATPASGCSFSPATIQPGQSSTLTVSASAVTATTTPVTISATDGTLTHIDTVLVHPSFTLQITPASATTIVGGTVTETISGQGIPGTETLSCSGLPAGASCSFSPAALTPGTTQSNLTVTVPDSTPYTDGSVTVVASDGSTTTSAPFNLRVSTFQLQSTNGTKVVAYGSNATATFDILNSSSAASPPTVTLGCIHLQASCSFNPAVVGPNQTSILTVSNLGPPVKGPAMTALTLTGTSGQETETQLLLYRVEDFSLAAQRTTGYREGDTATFVISVSSVGGLAQPVTMSCPNLPAGLTCSFAPDAVQDAASTTLTVSGLSSVSSFPLNLNVQGDIQGDTHSLALTVQKAPFQVTATPATDDHGTGDRLGNLHPGNVFHQRQPAEPDLRLWRPALPGGVLIQPGHGDRGKFHPDDPQRPQRPADGHFCRRRPDE